MACKPWLDQPRRTWYGKYKPDPGGQWVRIRLCKHEGRIHPEKDKNKIPRDGERKHRELEEIEFRAKHGMAPVQAKPVKLSEYLDGYLESKSLSLAPDSVRHLKNNIKQFLAFAGGKGVTTLQAVKQATCREFLELRQRTIMPAAAWSERGYLMAAWSRALRDELIAVNPWCGAKVIGPVVPKVITFWTGDEIAAISANCASPWLSDLVALMANTGLRVSTAMTSRWDWIDRGGTAMKIPKQHRVKTGYTHYLSATAKAILRRRREAVGGAPIAFPHPEHGAVMRYGRAYDGIQAAIAKAGVTPGGCHDFRHTYGRTLALRGVPVTVIQRQLGHTSLTHTLKYVTASEEHIVGFTDGIAIGVMGPATPDRPGT